MSRLFKRRVRVIVDTLLIEDLHVQFKVKKTLKKEPNTCEISIYNLSEASRAGMQRKHAKVILEAGYTDTMSQIFSGDARVIDHIHDGSNWITKAQCGDGERAFQYARITESFRPGSTVHQVARRLIAALGLPGVDALKAIGDNIQEQLTQGYSMIGPASRELDKLLKGRGLEWSIQDGQLQVIKKGDVTLRPAIVLSADTGMIGSPSHGTPGPDKKDKSNLLKVKSLIQPGIKPGGRIRIESETRDINGDYRVETVSHSGDTHGGDWFSEAEATPVKP